MADTPDLGSGAERYAGSTPAPSTCDLIEDLRISTVYSLDRFRANKSLENRYPVQLLSTESRQ